MPDRIGMEKGKNIRQGKTMLLSKCYIDAIVSRRCLQFKIKGTAKALAQREPPRLVDARAKRSMNNELHAACFVKKAFGYYGGLSRHGTEHRPALQHIFRQLLRGGSIQATFFPQPV